MTRPETPAEGSTRRSFLKQSSAAVVGGALLATPGLKPTRLTRHEEPLNIALVGCGGRGTSAAAQALSTAGPVRLIAMADAFQDRLESSYGSLMKNEAISAQVDVPPERRFVGFPAFQQAIDCDIDLVILTTPPGFRPLHFEYAILKNRHVFMEKPVAVDAPGIRRVLAAGELANKKNLKVGVGLQRHHEPRYRETLQRLWDGAIGDIVLYRCYWNSAGVWVRPRQESMTEMEYQMRNWYYFNWLCGDHIVEQHIHNLDVCNWAQRDYPISAQGQGGREVRTGKDHGEIFDHHMVEFTYGNGARMLSQCRHIGSCWSSVSEHAHGTLGTANISGAKIHGQGGWEWRYRSDGDKSPYQIEHDDLFSAIRADQPFNETEYGAKSTMTAILGRMATYSGKVITWEEALASKLALTPEAYDWTARPPTVPDDQGRYPIPTPGVTTVL
jgi:predicted dehydrogenase